MPRHRRDRISERRLLRSDFSNLPAPQTGNAVYTLTSFYHKILGFTLHLETGVICVRPGLSEKSLTYELKLLLPVMFKLGDL